MSPNSWALLGILQAVPEMLERPGEGLRADPRETHGDFPPSLSFFLSFWIFFFFAEHRVGGDLRHLKHE